MGLYQKIVGNAKKPAGFLGHMMLAGINLGHTGTIIGYLLLAAILSGICLLF